MGLETFFIPLALIKSNHQPVIAVNSNRDVKGLMQVTHHHAVRVLELQRPSHDRAVGTIKLDATRRLGRGGGSSPLLPL